LQGGHVVSPLYEAEKPLNDFHNTMMHGINTIVP
jgi:hypothetical protein